MSVTPQSCSASSTHPQYTSALTSRIDLTLAFREAEVGSWLVLSHYLRKGPAALSVVPTSLITYGLCPVPC